MFWCPTRPPHPYQNVRSLSIARMMCVSFRTPTMLATHISPPSSFPDFLYLEFVFGFCNFLARFIGVAWRGRVGGWGRRVVVRGCGPCGGGRSNAWPHHFENPCGAERTSRGPERARAAISSAERRAAISSGLEISPLLGHAV